MTHTHLLHTHICIHMYMEVWPSALKNPQAFSPSLGARGGCLVLRYLHVRQPEQRLPHQRHQGWRSVEMADRNHSRWNRKCIYHLVMTNSSPWKDPPFLSSVNHLFLWAIYTMAMLNNQMVMIIVSGIILTGGFYLATLWFPTIWSLYHNMGVKTT